MNKEIARMNSDAELERAKKALAEGNEGMARVCARRAVGVAVSFWLESNTREHYGTSAMNRLRSIQKDDTIPQEIKNAAEKLTTHINNSDTLPFTDDPLNDAKIIIDYFLT